MADNTIKVSTVNQIVKISTAIGLKGESVNPDDFYQTTNRLSELDTEQKKIDARQNLGVQVFDCGEFF